MPPTQKKHDFVVVANRLPVHRIRKQGRSTWQTSPGGLVSALIPILSRHPSAWVGWAGTAGKAPPPFVHEGIQNFPVELSRSEMDTYYEGCCNRTFWPLYHDAVRPPEYRRRWWKPYVDVNRRFAQAAAKLAAPGATVWVHDYHLQLVPGMVRKLRDDVRIGYFLHIPFPPQELFAQLPWRTQILEGLLGADVVGFHTEFGAANFAQLAKRYVNTRGSRGSIQYGDRTIRTGAYPISIDFHRFADLSITPDVVRRSQHFRTRLGARRKVILGVDRLDYTKGIDIRLRAYQELLRSERVGLEDCVLVQVAVPSRERVEEYQAMQSHIEQLIGQINGEFGELGRTPVHYLHRNLPIEELVALYQAADVMIVTPLRDGMNLVAKEYCATRTEDDGVLVLSEFTGAATELKQAMLVNPHDINGLEDALYRALHMPASEQIKRMRSLRKTIRTHDVYAWAKRFMNAMEG
jgi:trehalose 6-phosphate synthase